VAERLASEKIDGAFAGQADDASAIRIRLKLPDRKEHGLLKILEGCCEARPLQGALKIRRSAIFADGGDGNPVSFFEAFSKFS
jgi:hypothetical protein